MLRDRRSAPPGGADLLRTRSTVWIAAVLVGLVVVAAGIGGIAHFTGARWYPKFRPSVPGIPTGTQRSPGPMGGPGSPGSAGLGWLLVVAAAVGAIALVGLIVFFVSWWARLGRVATPGLAGPVRSAGVAPGAGWRAVETKPEPEPEPEPLLSGIALALSVLEEEREPADAIVRAWLGLEETAQESGIVRRAAETPTEFTARILSGAFVEDRAVHTLLRLYLRARFGDHPVTAGEVAAVREALEELLAGHRAGTR